MSLFERPRAHIILCGVQTSRAINPGLRLSSAYMHVVYYICIAALWRLSCGFSVICALCHSPGESEKEAILDYICVTDALI